MPAPIATRLLSLTPPPVPPTPLIGRDQVLRHADDRLDRTGVVAVTGIAGSGKTALAAHVAAAARPAVHWITVYSGVNSSSADLLLQLAAPLAELAPETWQALHMLHQTDRAYPLSVQLQMVLAGYRDATHLTTIILDGVDLLIEAGSIALIVALCDHVARRGGARLRLIVTGRMLPYDLTSYALPPLRLLDLPTLLEWATTAGSALTPEQAAQIIDQSAGFPAAVAHALADGTASPVRAERAFVEQLRHLSPEAWHVLTRLATDAPRTFSFAERLVLSHLEECHLIVRTPGHPITLAPSVKHVLRDIE